MPAARARQGPRIRSPDAPVALWRRRDVLARSLAAAGLLLAPALRSQAKSAIASALLLQNVTRLYPVRVARIVAPTNTAELARALSAWPGQVAVGGGRYSMGGQIGVEGGLHVDLRQMRNLVWLRPADPAVRVQAGMRWRDLQDHLDPLDLAVRTMQSYSNFTVGGSVSVNAHGRYVGHGPIAASVRALQIMLADGSIVEASRERHRDLFCAALGGYGGVGVITEVELALDHNSRLERRVDHVRCGDYAGFFRSRIEGDSDCVLHNADLLPPLFDRATAVSWSRTEKPVTVKERLVPRDRSYVLDQTVIWALTELPQGEKIQRKLVRPALLRGPAVVWRNYEASLDIASLEPRSRDASTYVLQEYFVPSRHFDAFTAEMVAVVRRRNARVLNISIRHSPPDQDAVMTWAREAVFCFVLYYKQSVNQPAMADVAAWTRELIDAVLRHEGTYYLPYQRHATQQQFDAAYPAKERFRRTKAVADPAGRMTNELWRQYL